jgi:hypothetical protein
VANVVTLLCVDRERRHFRQSPIAMFTAAITLITQVADTSKLILQKLPRGDGMAMALIKSIKNRTLSIRLLALHRVRRPEAGLEERESGVKKLQPQPPGDRKGKGAGLIQATDGNFLRDDPDWGSI